MISRIIQLIRRIRSKPFAVIAFRLQQITKIMLWRQINLWRLYSRRAEYSVGRLVTISQQTCLFAPELGSLTSRQRIALKDVAESVIQSRFKIFGYEVPSIESCDFSTDWRFGYRWGHQFYKKYQFYVTKELPFDVKFPWELSRLHYLVPVLAWQVVGSVDVKVLSWVLAILRRWREQNILAYSVNWYPMEASMRAINLVMLLDLVKILRRQANGSEADDLLDACSRLLLTMLLEHGQFVWLNREFTDVRGNHFTANLVALQLVERVLSFENLGNRKWGKYANGFVEREVLLQFYDDGVNFEKSCAYHKLVLELFMLSAIASSRAGKKFSSEVNERLIAAAGFCDAVSRPDGKAAGFGDTDDAVGLPFLLESTRSHGMVVDLARSFFGIQIGSHPFDEAEGIAAVFLVGRAGPVPRIVDGPELRYFRSGGYVVVRNRDNGFFLMVDIGEVGMAGRGGHGHNDLLSFELCINGLPVVVDPGCSGYTADLEKKSKFRSTAFHSTVQLFNAEIARFAGHWGIHNDAVPQDVQVEATSAGAVVQAGHFGYSRLYSGAFVRRVLNVDAVKQILTICDEVETPVDNTSVRWHFPSGSLVPTIGSGGVHFKISEGAYLIFFGSVRLDVARSLYSEGYGQECEGCVVVGETSVNQGKHAFQFEIGTKQGLRFSL